MTPFLTVERRGRVAILTMDRPDSMNAIGTIEDCDNIVDTFFQLGNDRSVSAIVLTGAGRAFCTGGNIKGIRDRQGIGPLDQPDSTATNYRRGVQRATRAMLDCDVPMIAAINGHAIGLGLDLACVCDMRVAADSAKMAASFIKVGIIPGDGGAWTLQKLIGYPLAAELFLTGRTFDAAYAQSIGLVGDVVPAAELMDKAMALAEEIAANSPRALRLTKRLLREAQHGRAGDVLELSAAFQALVHETADHKEAVNALLEKRAPVFTGTELSGEAAFIAALQGLASHPAARGLTDDCAVLELGGETLILTHDMMVEGVHWLAGQDPADVAWKLLATNLSDLAAKGAEPIGVLLGYSLAAENARFVEGLGQALAHFGVPLLGGDTVRTPGPQTLGLTALGRATHRPVPSRSGARAGDSVWITGPVGAAMLGFEALQSASGADSAAYRRPVPRLSEGRALAPLVTAMMDVSDGLLLDTRRMAEASAVTIALDPALIPFPADLPPARTRDALTWGDDYELLFTLPAGQAPPCPATRIGEVRKRGDQPLLLGGTAPEGPLGYEHG